MKIDVKTKIGDLLKEYPWLVDELIKQNKQFEALKNPAAKLILKAATIEDASKTVGIDKDQLVKNLTSMIAAHK